eukprot:1412746-Rhodomonas_salina.1
MTRYEKGSKTAVNSVLVSSLHREQHLESRFHSGCPSFVRKYVENTGPIIKFVPWGAGTQGIPGT